MERFENKYDLLSAAYRDKELKKGTIALLQYLVHKSNKEQCFPAVDTIAKALGVCRRTVQYNMRKLEKAGYIIRKDRCYNHLQRTNQYIFYFGITEDKTEAVKYSGSEYEMLNQLSLFNPSDASIQKSVSDAKAEYPQDSICKISEIQKIYSMELAAREKLLLIYLYHRANKQGIVYDTVQVLMEAVGIRGRTFHKLLTSLRRKGLLKVKECVVHGRVHLVMKLTGEVYQGDVKERDNAISGQAGRNHNGEGRQNTKSGACCHIRMNGRYIRKSRKYRKRRYTFIRKLLPPGRLFQKFALLCCRKVKEILRI